MGQQEGEFAEQGDITHGGERVWVVAVGGEDGDRGSRIERAILDPPSSILLL
jgi:hypothetical protein